MEIKSILGEKVLIEWRKMQSLQPDNLKLPYNIAYLKQSLIENNFAMPFFGWQNGEDVYVVDGHQRLQVLIELEGEGVKIPELLDCQLIKAKDRKEAVKILLKVYNQRSNPIDLEVLTEWINIEQVEVEVQSLNVVDIQDVEESQNEEIKDNPYTKKVEAPIYEPNNEKPLFSEVYSSEKFNELVEKIESSSVYKEIKEFLKLAATRHIVFNYQKIADLYANSDKEAQELMEESALVIIDFKKAIEKGYVKISNEIEDKFLQEYGNEL